LGATSVDNQIRIMATKALGAQRVPVHHAVLHFGETRMYRSAKVAGLALSAVIAAIAQMSLAGASRAAEPLHVDGGAIAHVARDALGVRAFKWQPVATVISVAWAIAYTSMAERRFYVSPEAREMRIVLWCLIGGFVAQATQIVVDRRFSIGPLWIAMGILGIGGGFGIGSMALVRAWFFTVTFARLLFRWRAA